MIPRGRRCNSVRRASLDGPDGILEVWKIVHQHMLVPLFPVRYVTPQEPNSTPVCRNVARSFSFKISYPFHLRWGKWCPSSEPVTNPLKLAASANLARNRQSARLQFFTWFILLQGVKRRSLNRCLTILCKGHLRFWQRYFIMPILSFWRSVGQPSPEKSRKKSRKSHEKVTNHAKRHESRKSHESRKTPRVTKIVAQIF